MAPRETENSAFVKFWSDEKRALWFVVVFSGVVNWNIQDRLPLMVADKCPSGLASQGPK